ncbi:MAG TPA: tetratricopeptide repeat protein [Bacteroidia bacterium]
MFFPLLAGASFDFNSSCRDAYKDILGLEMEKGRGILEAERKLHAENSITVLLDNYTDFLTLVITEERDKYDAWKKRKSERLAVIEDDSKDSPWFLYCKAEINLQWAFTEIKFGDYKDAAVDINKAFKQLGSNEKKFPGFIPTKKGLGLLHALIGNIPANYKWAADLVGMSGTVKQGIAELEAVLAETQKQNQFAYLETETLFYLSFIQLNLNNDETAEEKIFQRLSEKRMSQPLLVYAAAGMALHTGRCARAFEFISQLPADASRLPFHYLGYLQGVALMNKLDTNAAKYFRVYVRNFKGINFIRSAYRGLAWCCLISNDKDGYARYMELVKTNGSSMTDEDKQALKDAQGNVMPEVNLLRSRLLFDGGYYREALDAVLKMEPKNSRSIHDIIEFEYRLARIHHKMGDTQTAIRYYELAYSSGEKYPFYFAANSALQLGLIYETMNDKVHSAEWFKKCLALHDHEYQDSIELKAKAGLSRVQ